LELGGEMEELSAEKAEVQPRLARFWMKGS